MVAIPQPDSMATIYLFIFFISFCLVLFITSGKEILILFTPVPEVYVITWGKEAKELVLPCLNTSRLAVIYAEYEPELTSLTRSIKGS